MPCNGKDDVISGNYTSMKLVFNIAIVGRPNVGKSRLFNRLARKRISIVHDTPGVTRDIITYEIDKNVILMDTGGLGLSGKGSIDEITRAVDDQVLFAISSADLIFFVVDDVMPMDYNIADILRKSGGDVILIANKIDTVDKSYYFLENFKKLGLGEPVIASAEHGIGEDTIRALITIKTKKFVEQQRSDEDSKDPIKIAFVGRPNVGKSSTINAILNEERVIVSDVSGTTRESIAVTIPKLQNSLTGRGFEILDTAGLHPQNRISTSLDYFSSLRTREGMINCDVIFIIVDATSGITKLDKKIANEVIDAGKGVIILVNKWDIAQESFKRQEIDGYKNIKDFQEKFADAVQRELKNLPGVEVIFFSAKNKYGLGNLLSMAEKLFSKMYKKIGTGQLNHVLHSAIDKHPSTAKNGKIFRMYYAVQTGNVPFIFKLFCNNESLIAESYKKFLLNVLRENFDLAGCSIKLEFVEKERRYADAENFQK